MQIHDSIPRSNCFAHALTRLGIISTALAVAAVASQAVRQPAMAAAVDPFQGGPADAAQIPLPYREGQGEGSPTKQKPTNTPAHITQAAPQKIHTADYQSTNQTPFADDAANDLKAPTAQSKSPLATNDPCAAVPAKRFNQFGISIAQPAGKLPTDLAAPCSQQVNQKAGPSAAGRCWPVLCYNWDATCLCYQPLYFEEINLERYGYQCGDRSCCCSCGRECCLQPAASAFHFFGTVPCLPYCMMAECPGDCIYTLGHYRPGSAPPLRWHWPPCDPIAAAGTAGFYVGMIAAFP